jgi:hypothetical protein
LVKGLFEALEFAAVLDESTLDAIPTALVDDCQSSVEREDLTRRKLAELFKALVLTRRHLSPAGRSNDAEGLGKS